MSTIKIENSNLTRIYRVNFVDLASGFVPGRTGDGEQVLMGVLEKELLVAFFFSGAGEFSSYLFRPVPYIPDPNLGPGQQQLRLGYSLQAALRDWINELGMTPRDIHIRHFAFPDWEIGIAEWPLASFPIVQKALAEGTPLEDEFLLEWQEQKRWVLHWHKEYWMYEDGEIGDT